jgi:hypothetical protein
MRRKSCRKIEKVRRYLHKIPTMLSISMIAAVQVFLPFGAGKSKFFEAIILVCYQCCAVDSIYKIPTISMIAAVQVFVHSVAVDSIIYKKPTILVAISMISAVRTRTAVFALQPLFTVDRTLLVELTYCTCTEVQPLLPSSIK